MSSIRTLFSHRNLLFTLVKRDIALRYTGSAIGFVWTVINPIFLLIIYSVLFTSIIRVKLGEVPYNFVEFLFCGFWPWIAFQEAIIRSTNSIVENGNLIKSVIFPSEILTPSLVLSSFFQQFIGFLLFIAVFYGFLNIGICGSDHPEISRNRLGAAHFIKYKKPKA